VQELRKPTLSAWTVNQLARRRRKEIDLLLDAGHRLATAQRALLTGGGQKAFDEARKREQGALKRLQEAAPTILGKRASATTLERVVSTLRAAALSDEARPDLARGRLTADVSLTGFEAFTGISVGAAGPPRERAAAPTRSTEKPDRPDQVARRAAERREAVNRARADVRTTKEREAQLAKQLREAESAVRAAEKDLRAAEQEADRLGRELESATKAVEAARSKLEASRES
jgi:hypothetical protein